MKEDRLQDRQLNSSLTVPRELGWTGALLVAFVVLLGYGGTSLLTGQTSTRQHAYFDHLAVAFLDGRLDLTNPPGHSDLTPHDGKWYVPFPPLVAGLMLPWIAVFGLANMNSVWFSILFGVLNVALLARILDELARRCWIALGVGSRVWLLALFAFGYLHWQVAIEGSVWFLSHTCTVTFIALAVWLALKCKRPWLPALALALAIWGRPTVLFTWPLLAGIVAQKLHDRRAQASVPPREDMASANPFHATADSGTGCDASILPAMLRWSVLSALPLLVSIAGMAGYNYARFQNIFDFGYGRQKIDTEVVGDLSRGQFHIHHIPLNVHVLLFGRPIWHPSERHPDWRLPVPDDHGLSLFLATPAFLYVFRVRPRRTAPDPHAAPSAFSRPRILLASSWLAIGLTLVPLLLYYNTGWRQFGYRFSLDFIIPLMILLAVACGSRTTRGFRVLVVLGMLVNAWGIVWWYTKWLD